MAKIWNSWILWTCGVKVEIAKKDIIKLFTPHAKIIVSNHKSHLDSCVLWSVMPKDVILCFAAKKELFKIPIFGKILQYSGSIVIDRQNAQIAIHNLKDFFTTTKSTKTLVIYAEGTRSKSDKLLPFKRGPFVIAKEMGIPILPVVIHGTAKALPSGKLWPKATTATIKVLDMVTTEYLELEEPNTIRSQLWQTMQENLQLLS
jgi:1-acyl-sn-glycerol-3-phosphate acyltransferase